VSPESLAANAPVVRVTRLWDAVGAWRIFGAYQQVANARGVFVVGAKASVVHATPPACACASVNLTATSACACVSVCAISLPSSFLITCPADHE